MFKFQVDEVSNRDLYNVFTARGGYGLTSSITFRTFTNSGVKSGGAIGHDGDTETLWFSHGTGGDGAIKDMVIDYSGNVGIGTIDPKAMLEVTGDVYFEGGDGDVDLDGDINVVDAMLISTYLSGGVLSREQLTHADVDGDGRVTWDDIAMNTLLTGNMPRDDVKRKIHSLYGAINSETFYVNGNVGIGTTTPSYELDVNGTIRGDNVTPSDERLKENIETIDNALEKVAALLR